MRRSVLIASVAAAFLALTAPAQAQTSALERERDAYLRDRAAFMVGLSVWSAVNITAGSYFLLADPPGKQPKPGDRSFRRGFWSMALAYGLINGVLAAGTLATLSRERDTLTSPTIIDFRRRQSATVFTANVGLEMFTFGVGAALWSEGPSGLARGTGAGFMAQNGFLLMFDGTAAAVNRYH